MIRAIVIYAIRTPINIMKQEQIKIMKKLGQYEESNPDTPIIIIAKPTEKVKTTPLNIRQLYISVITQVITQSLKNIVNQYCPIGNETKAIDPDEELYEFEWQTH